MRVLDQELESEYEGEYEGEEFLGAIAGAARRTLSSPALRRVGTHAAQAALRAGTGGLPPGVGGVLRGLGLGESEFEGEDEFEFEGEGEWEAVAPVVAPNTEMLMEHLAHAASEAESEEEAEAFLGALVPLAAQIIPRLAPAVIRAAPQLIRGVSNVARTLMRNPETRQLVRAVPTVLSRTVQSLADHASSGRPVTAQRAVQTLARQTGRVLSNPRTCRCALQRSRQLDRRYHQTRRAAGAVPA